MPRARYGDSSQAKLQALWDKLGLGPGKIRKVRLLNQFGYVRKWWLVIRSEAVGDFIQLSTEYSTARKIILGLSKRSSRSVASLIKDEAEHGKD